MNYDQEQKAKVYGRIKDKLSIRWMVVVSIIFHVFILYLIIPNTNATRKWQDPKHNFIKMKRFVKPPPMEQKPEQQKKKIKQKRLVKPMPEMQMEELEPVTVDDQFELIYNFEDFEFEDPDPIPDRPVRVGGDIKSPVLVHRVNPEYPEVALRNRIEGIVYLEAVISRDGQVMDVRVTGTLNSFCDNAAIKAVRQWKFDPGTMNGTPVDVIMSLTVVFKIS